LPFICPLDEADQAWVYLNALFCQCGNYVLRFRSSVGFQELANFLRLVDIGFLGHESVSPEMKMEATVKIQEARLFLELIVEAKRGSQSEAETVGALVNAAIPFFVGIYCLLVGFRVVGSKPGVNPKYDQWHERFGLFFKIAGPVLMLVGVGYLLIDLAARR
jgi:hypothetical protein